MGDEQVTKITLKKGRIRFTRKRQRVFIANLCQYGNVSHAAEQVGIDRHTAYMHRNKDADFAVAWDDALEVACDGMEKEARRRAVEGTTKELLFDADGNLIHEVKAYSDTLLIFLLKAHRPKKFRETIRQEITGADGGPVVLTVVEEIVDAKPSGQDMLDEDTGGVQGE